MRLMRVFLLVCLGVCVLVRGPTTAAKDTDARLSKGQDLAFERYSNPQCTTHQNLMFRMVSYFPSSYSILQQMEQRLFQSGESQGRGPKDLIAIVSTMLATLLGAILVKLNVLIVLSVISVAIGKLLLFILTLKGKIFHNDVPHSPVVYEKVVYPYHHTHHRDDHLQLPQNAEESFIYSS